MTRSRKAKAVWAGLAVAVCAAGLHANSVRNGFTLDDRLVIGLNPMIQDLARVPDLFRSDYWAPELQRGLYRPLVTTSYAINHALGGTEPWGYHLANVLLHTANSLLVWWLGLLIVGSLPVATLAGLLFASHAVHTEAVNSISLGRPELLLGLFLLLGLLCHVLERRRAARSVTWLGAASLTAFGLALLCKETAVALLALIFVYDLLYLPRQTPGLGGVARFLRSESLRYGAYGVVFAAYLLVRWLALRDTGVFPPRVPLDNPLWTLSFPWWHVNALKVAGHYLWLLILPLRLAYDYSFDQIRLVESLEFAVALCAIGLAAFVGLAVACSRRSRHGAFALALLLLPFLPISNLLVRIGTILGERLLYVPSVGFCLGAALLLHELAGRMQRWPPARFAVLVVLPAVVLTGHGWRTLDRNVDWRSDGRLYLHDLGVAPRSARVLNNAAFVLSRVGRVDDAINLYRTAIQIMPEGFARPYRSLGLLLLQKKGETERGLALLEKAASLRPRDPGFLDTLAWGYYQAGRYEEARTWMTASLELNDTDRTARRRRERLRAIEQALSRPAAGEAAPAAKPEGR